ncbi:DNA-binding MarR family transcriptional regulator [Rhodococcus wratislaviensis]|uniref:MarR family transcriptional regulator n=3 Tax=Rhodococcus TaxID=1827 RepID=A0AB38FPB4_RHOWR|nr:MULTISPECIES: MarR family transcriptional regulator [Rhodococcus]AII04041.1 MarR family transcriptional regulator [Rhodococcus opacus]REE71383.1 DNA-binding MarR family transcriptional regulator [Rhodococcus wratislaviensis]GAF48685.1 putative MarR family transcriptional regulator [Rhodococcus wratislaviensis NBRC 100605]SPZ43287.1 MarR family transcriptional regulator [Rhodococcus wratislaviensis]
MAIAQPPISAPVADSVAAPYAPLLAAVLQTQKLITHHLNATLRPLGLSFARYEVLAMIVAANGPLPMVQIVRALDRHPTTIGTLIDGLEGSGLAVRATNRSDRRSTLVSVTDRGREVAVSATRALDALALVDPNIMSRLHDDLHHLLSATRRALTAAPGGQRIAAADLPGGRP